MTAETKPTPGPLTLKGQEIFAADGTCICYVRYNGEEGDPESQATGGLLIAAYNMAQSAAEQLGCDPLALAEAMGERGLVMVRDVLHMMLVFYGMDEDPNEASGALHREARAALALFPERKP